MVDRTRRPVLVKGIGANRERGLLVAYMDQRPLSHTVVTIPTRLKKMTMDEYLDWQQ